MGASNKAPQSRRWLVYGGTIFIALFLGMVIGNLVTRNSYAETHAEDCVWNHPGVTAELGAPYVITPKNEWINLIHNILPTNDYEFTFTVRGNRARGEVDVELVEKGDSWMQPTLTLRYDSTEGENTIPLHD